MEKKSLFFVMLMVLAVLAVLVIAAPALAQRRDRGTNQRRSSDRSSYRQQQRSSQQQQHRSYRQQRPRQFYQQQQHHHRSHQRWGGWGWGGSWGWNGDGYYGGGYYGGYYNGYYGRYRLTGLKFDLGRIDGSERKAVSDGTVFVDEFNFGIVDRFDGRWNRVLPLEPGTHQVKVELRDGRIFEADIDVEIGRTVYLYPEFSTEP